MGFRSDSRQRSRSQKQQLEQIQERKFNGQTRGDLAAPDKNDPRYNYNTYKYDYFAGAQCKVYFGDIWVDDVITIQYNTIQNKEPIYGYASQNFDAVAMGTFLGQGSLTIAFKEVGYLNVVKAVLDEQRKNADNAKLNVVNRLRSNQETNISSNVRTSSEYAASINQNMTPGLIRKSETIENILDDLNGLGTTPYDFTITKRAKQLASDKNISLSAATQKIRTNPTKYGLKPDLFRNDQGSVRDFEDVAEIMEDTIWGDSNGIPFGDKRAQMLRADEFDYTYSNFQVNGIKTALGDDYSNVLNIMLTFGDINDLRAEHTMVLLNDVHFTGQGLLSAPNGEPIAETYNFFFRDINKSISQTVFDINPVKFHIGTDNAIDLAKLKDVDKFTEMLDDHGAIVNINIVSGLDDGKWTPTNRSFDASEYLGYIYKNDPGVGGAASLNRYVEEAMQRYYTVKPFESRPDRVAIEVIVTPMNNSAELDRPHFNYILDRQGEGTSNYIVTSPTKDDFVSLDLVRREDFFIPAAPIEDETVKSPQAAEIQNNQTKKTDSTNGNVTVGETSQDELNPAGIELYKKSVAAIDTSQLDAAIEIEETGVDPYMSAEANIQLALEDPDLSRREKRRLQKQLNEIREINAEIELTQAELNKINGVIPFEPSDAILDAIVEPEVTDKDFEPFTAEGQYDDLPRTNLGVLRQAKAILEKEELTQEDAQFLVDAVANKKIASAIFEGKTGIQIEQANQALSILNKFQEEGVTIQLGEGAAQSEELNQLNSIINDVNPNILSEETKQLKKQFSSLFDGTGVQTATVAEHIARENESNPATDLVFTSQQGTKIAVSPVKGTAFYNPDTKTISIDEGTGVITVIAHQQPTAELVNKGISPKTGVKVQAGEVIGVNIWDKGQTADFTGLHGHYWKQSVITDETGAKTLVDIPDSGKVIIDEFSNIGITIINKGS